MLQRDPLWAANWLPHCILVAEPWDKQGSRALPLAAYRQWGSHAIHLATVAGLAWASRQDSRGIQAGKSHQSHILSLHSELGNSKPGPPASVLLLRCPSSPGGPRRFATLRVLCLPSAMCFRDYSYISQGGAEKQTEAIMCAPRVSFNVTRLVGCEYLKSHTPDYDRYAIRLSFLQRFYLTCCEN